VEGVDLISVRIGLLQYLLVLGSLALHGWARARSADLLGDPTPRALGRVTLNPLVHVDPIGTVLVPLVCLLGFNGVLLGWAKPVPTTPSAFRRPRTYDTLSILAGPALHFLIAAAGVVAGILCARIGRPDEIFGSLIQINAALGVVTLLPIPPLAGGELLRHAVKLSDASFAQISRWSGLVMLLALNFETVQRGLMWLVFSACWPFVHLCRVLSPAALPRLFG
jgi:Zn-dependent protease